MSPSPDIFLSYSREDQAAARRFAEGFAREGFNVWWDATLRSGEAYDQVTEKALRDARAVVVLWSKSSVDSRWVRAEATMADRNKTLVPVMIEPCDRPIMFELTQTAELSHWQGNTADAAWCALVEDVRLFVEQVRSASASAIASPPLVVAGTFPSLSRLSVAVLPFANMSADPEQEYFADGITEDIITDLSKVAALGVISRNSAFTFKGKHVDVRQVARQLNVTHVLEGSVRKAGNRVRITAQLIEGANDNHVWAERYDRDLSDIFALQDEIAQAIVAALKLKLLPTEREAIEDRGTTSTEAFDLVLRARVLARSYAPASMAQALQYFRQAVAVDPDYALAWSTFASSLLTAAINLPESRERLFKELDHAVARAVALAPEDWSTQLALASYHVARLDWRGAEEATDNAVGRAPPSESGPLQSRMVWLWATGQLGKACECVPVLLRREPLSLFVSATSAMLLMIADRTAEAEAEYERSKDFEGDHAIADFWAFLRARRLPDGGAQIVPRFRRFLLTESLPMAVHQELKGLLHDREKALAVLRRACGEPEYQDSTRQSILGLWAAFFDDVELAFTCNRRSLLEFRGIATLTSLWDPNLKALRNDPRFKDLLRKVGLLDYYRRSGRWPDGARPLGEDDIEFA